LSAELSYDRADALARLGGDEELLCDASQLFMAESSDYCHALQAALDAADAPTLRREAHSVKSMFATFSCEHGRSLAAQLEQLAASGQLTGATEQVADVVATIRQLAGILAQAVAGR